MTRPRDSRGDAILIFLESDAVAGAENFEEKLLERLFFAFPGGWPGIAVAVWLSLLPGSASTIFDSKPSTIFALTMLVTIIGLGPGAFSVDARILGRREIGIPPRTPLSR